MLRMLLQIDRSAGGVDADRKLRPLWTVW
eukprot:COSAG01_NODE_73350_length_247_cov_27.358108_2_plen_28_part_01